MSGLLSTAQITKIKNSIKRIRQTVCDKTVEYYKYDPVTTQKDPFYDEARNKAYYAPVEFKARIQNKQSIGLILKEGGYDFDFDVMLWFSREHLVEKGLGLLVNQDSYETAHELFIKDKFIVEGKEAHIVKIIPAGQLDGEYQIFKVFVKFVSQATDLPLQIDTWFDIERITNSSSDSLNPKVILEPDGDIRVLFIDDRTGVFNVYTDKRRNGTWYGNSVLSSTSNQVSEVNGIIDNNNQLNLIYVDKSGSTYTLEHKLYNVPSPPASPIRTGTNYLSNIDIAQTPDETTHIIWQENNNVYHSYKTATALTWSTPVTVTTLSGTNNNPYICVNGDVLVLVWENTQGANANIYYLHYLDGIWGALEALTTSNTAHKPGVSSTSTGNLYLAYEDTKTGTSQIYMRVKSNNTWGAEVLVTSGSGNNTEPCIGVSESNVPIISYHQSGDVYVNKYSSGMFGNPELVSHGNSSVLISDIIVDPQGIPYIVWDDDNTGNYELYLRTKGAY